MSHKNFGKIMKETFHIMTSTVWFDEKSQSLSAFPSTGFVQVSI